MLRRIESSKQSRQWLSHPAREGEQSPSHPPTNERENKMETTSPLFDIEVQLTGNDGNAFAIMASVSSALKKAGATKEQLDAYYSESTSGDYDHLLRTAMKYVNVA
jgi:hypothetical protein